MNIQKWMVKEYEKIRKEGCFNMIMCAREVAILIGITTTEYFYILQNYSELMEEFELTTEGE